MNSGYFKVKSRISASYGMHVDHATDTVIANVFGKRKEDVFKELKALLTPFKISRYYTDDWGELMSET